MPVRPVLALVTSGLTLAGAVIALSPPAGAAPVSYQAESATLAGGAVVGGDHTGYTGSGFVGGYTDTDKGTASTTFGIDVSTAGSYSIGLRYANGTTATMSLSESVDGAAANQISLPATANWDTWATQTSSASLAAGHHTVRISFGSSDSGNVNLDELTVDAAAAPPPADSDRGAAVPYTEYEAEAASTTGSILGPDRTYLSPASEASGRKAVRLAGTGQYVRFTLTQPTNSLVVRYSIPDSADGTGQTAPLSLYAGSTKLPDLSLSSVYSWVYGDYPYTNTPAQGSPHHFFDEVHVLLGQTLAAGTTLTLQKDAADPAAYYDIDLIDTEQVAAVAGQPAGSVSVTNYGATANDGSDDTNAINTAVSAAAGSGSVLWFPAGSFNITSRINLSGVTVQGAGEWYTTVRGADGKGGFFATGSNVHISGLLIAGDVRYRDDANFDTGIEGNFGTGSSVHDVWIEHTKVGMWIDSGTRGLTVTDVRIRDTFADGINIHADVQDTTVSDTAVRNTGDDGLAMFSQGSPVTRSAFVHDTVQLPLLGNGIGIYGGTDNRAENDLVADTVYAAAGIAVGNRFSPVALAGTTIVDNLTLSRTGGFEPVTGQNVGGLWIYADEADISAPITVSNLDIDDSTNSGVLLSQGHAINNLTLNDVKINGAGAFGIQTDAVSGSATFTGVTVTGAASGGLSNPSGYTINRGAGDSGF